MGGKASPLYHIQRKLSFKREFSIITLKGAILAQSVTTLTCWLGSDREIIGCILNRRGFLPPEKKGKMQDIWNGKYWLLGFKLISYIEGFFAAKSVKQMSFGVLFCGMSTWNEPHDRILIDELGIILVSSRCIALVIPKRVFLCFL